MLHRIFFTPFFVFGKKTIGSILCLLWCLLAAGQQSADVPVLSLIDSGYLFYQAPFKSCHASTITSLSDGRLMAAWFAGTHEGSEDVAIWVAKREKNTWTTPVQVADGKQVNGKTYPCWNPVLFRSSEGLLFLFYKVGPNPREWWGEVKTSADDGGSWSSPRRLPDGFLGPVKNKPLQLANGDILYPSSMESVEGDRWTVHIERSDRQGNQWKKMALDEDTFGVIQPSILTHADGRMQILCRSRQNVIAQSWSADNGNTWEPITATHLPNPNSGTDAVTLHNGWQLLVYNPLLAGKEWWEGRSVLRVALSADGINWKDAFTLEDHREGEYSYPAVIQTKDGVIHITYTHARSRIRHVQLKLNKTLIP